MLELGLLTQYSTCRPYAFTDGTTLCAYIASAQDNTPPHIAMLYVLKHYRYND
jgi:hypothetical protein